jgi:hypothetical protein
MIKYISFMPGVSVTVGVQNIPTMNGYAFEKHAEAMDIEETATEIHFLFKVKGKRTGDRVRLPKTSIATIRETVEQALPPNKVIK